MGLTVLSVSYALALVSPRTAGGAEQVLATLDESLVLAGHRSIVLAPAGSRCSGLLIPGPAVPGVLDQQMQERVRHGYRETLQKMLARFPIDVVHLHGLDFLDYLPPAGVPVVVTLHLPPSWYTEDAFWLDRPATYLVCVSWSQSRVCPPHARIGQVIENGVSLERFHPEKKKGKYALGLGRICPEKGIHLALDAASAADLPLFLAGTAFGYPSHQSYFEETIRPRLRDGHRFLGAIGGVRKQKLLAGARCLVVTSQVAETSSLAAIEALACGTPVVAFRVGALCDLIEDGRTGYLVDRLTDLPDAIRASQELDPAACRREAELRFSSKTMHAKYMDLYRKALGKSVHGPVHSPVHNEDPQLCEATC
jgi:glycosyltransferase involved in cell wall biosynthesis